MLDKIVDIQGVVLDSINPCVVVSARRTTRLQV